MRAYQALAVAFGVALIGTVASAAWADEAASSYNNPAIAPAPTAQATMVMNEQTADANIAARRQQLLTQPDPSLDVAPWSMYRDGAGEIVNPQTGTPLPWTVQP